MFKNNLTLPVSQFDYAVLSTNQHFNNANPCITFKCNGWLKTCRLIYHYLCTCQRTSWTYLPQVFTSVHLFNKIVRWRFTISSPLFQNKWVKIHHRENKVGWRFHYADLFFLGQDSLLSKGCFTIRVHFQKLHSSHVLTVEAYFDFKVLWPKHWSGLGLPTAIKRRLESINFSKKYAHS